MWMKIKTGLLILLLTLTGCGPAIVKHPDAPMLIMESRGRALVALEDEGGRLVRYGWIEVPQGWTLVKYDWKKIEKSEK